MDDWDLEMVVYLVLVVTILLGLSFCCPNDVHRQTFYVPVLRKVAEDQNF